MPGTGKVGTPDGQRMAGENREKQNRLRTPGMGPDITEDQVFCRILAGTLLFACCFAAVIFRLHLQHIFFTPCWFYRTVGLYCPGCGGTRALTALLSGNPLRSLRMNPLVLPAAIWMAVYLGSHFISSVTRGRTPVLRISRAPFIAGAVLLGVNWILKNALLIFWGIDLLN
jgi:hypothetical protein